MRLTHEAIRRGLESLEVKCQDNSSSSIAEIQQQYDDLIRVILLHADQEDEAFYPPVDARRTGVIDSFVKDHESERRTHAEINALFERADAPLAPEIRRKIRSWITDHRVHLDAEETVFSPLLAELFDYRESVDVVRGILKVDTTEYQDHHLPWVVKHLGGDQRRMYYAMLSACSPRESREKSIEIVKSMLSEEERKEFGEEGLLAG
jgi:hypothetical protein